MSSPAPVLLLAGFFGAGKTTLLRRWASDAAFRASIVEVDALEGPLAALERIEGDPVLAERFHPAGVVAVVDALDAEGFASRPARRAHVMLADALVIAKVDLVRADAVQRLEETLASINPDAEILRSDAPGLDARRVWDAANRASGREVRRLRAQMDSGGAGGEPIDAFTLRLEGSVELSGFCMGLAGFLERHNGRVLRVKGLVRAEGRRGPAAIQAVGRKLYPVRTLRSWPRGVDGSTLAVIAQGPGREEIREGVEDAARIAAPGSSRRR